MLRTYLAYVLAFMVTGSSGNAFANHGATLPRDNQSVSDQTSRTRMNASATALYLNDMKTTVWTLSTDSQLRFGDIGVRLRVPMHAVAPAAGSSELGLGDVSLAALWHFEGPRQWRLAAGLAGFLPTGSTSSGFGQGVVALAPTIAAARELRSDLTLVASASLLLDVTSRPEMAPGIEPRGTIEPRGGFGVNYRRAGMQASGELRVALPVAGEASGATLVSLAPSAMIRLDGNWWAAAFAALPVGVDRRFEWQAGAALAYYWQPGS